MRPIPADAPERRTSPPSGLPFEVVHVGRRSIVLRTRETIATMQRRYAPWRDAFLEGKAAREAEAAGLEAGDRAAVNAARERHDAASDRVERLHAGLLMLAWRDGSGDLLTRDRWDAREFSGAEEPIEAAGAAVIDELMADGWEPAEINEAGAAVLTGYVRGLGLMPAPSEVEALAEVFPEATETPT